MKSIWKQEWKSIYFIWEDMNFKGREWTEKYFFEKKSLFSFLTSQQIFFSVPPEDDSDDEIVFSDEE